MKPSQLYFILICIALTSAKLLGPNKPNDSGKTSDDEDNAEINTASSEPTSPVEEEYIDVMEKAKSIPKDTDNVKDPILAEDQFENLEMYINMLQKTLLRNTGQRSSILDPIDVDTVSNIGKNDDNPQDLLDQLPPLAEEDTTELTPELQEAKELYDVALSKLKRRTSDLRGTILQVKQAADLGYKPAKIKLAWSYLFGEGVEFDVDKAKAIFAPMAEEGNADAHAGMGFLYATGTAVPVSQAKALLHYTMGAIGDSDYAQMALAYRYWSGLTVPSSCPKAMELYMRVASKVANNVNINGGPAIQRVRLIDEAEGGGVSGGALDTDLIEYYQLLAEKGDVQAQVGLGQLHFQGGRGVTLDLNKALHYFQQAAKAGNAVANAFLGKIYLEGGDGIRADNETALRYFRKAADTNNPVGLSGLGLMYLQGRGVPKDLTAALKYFTLAANQGWVEGQLHLGFMYFGGIGVRRDFKQAIKYFSLASQSGHVLALYHLAQMHAQGLGVRSSCTTAVDLFKNVCERGEWGYRLMLAHAAYRARDTDSSLLQYLSMAERGYEVAQSNAAYLLDNGEVSMYPREERWTRALQLWGRAAAQGSAAARVKLGDYHYYGLGTRVNLQAAAHHYRIASEQLHSAQATFNLGYMHERGLGLTKDLHLAKRCYDLAADTSPDARLPAALALASLDARTRLERLSESLLQSPLASILLTGGDSPLFANWDLYLITVLLGALGIVIYLRRVPQPAN